MVRSHTVCPLAYRKGFGWPRESNPVLYIHSVVFYPDELRPPFKNVLYRYGLPHNPPKHNHLKKYVKEKAPNISEWGLTTF